MSTWKSTPRLLVLLSAFLLLLPLVSAHAGEKEEFQGTMADVILPKGLSGVRLGVNLMMGYRHDDSPTLDEFVAKRAYIDLRVKVNDWLDVRITPDVYPDDDGTEYRLKYGHGRVHGDRAGFITSPFLEMGLVHTPWLEFEEHINAYRLQDPMFQERVGLITSADYGFTIGGYFAGKLDKATVEKLGGSPSPGRYGSFAAGIYNGAGYYAAEMNSNKTLMTRFTLRPLPDHFAGLQISHNFVYGRGNREEDFVLVEADSTEHVIGTLPLYLLNGLMVSYEQRYFTLVAQGVMGQGNRHGTKIWEGAPTDDYTRGESLEYQGASLFGEVKLQPYPFSVIGRFDRFDLDIHNPDNGYDRIIGGIAYRPDKAFLVLLDVEQTTYEDPTVEEELRVQLMMQFKTL